MSPSAMYPSIHSPVAAPLRGECSLVTADVARPSGVPSMYIQGKHRPIGTLAARLCARMLGVYMVGWKRQRRAFEVGIDTKTKEKR